MHWLTGTLAHFLLGMIAVLVYVVQTRAHAERRPPTSAIAWVLSLALLPYVALPLYFAFGRRKAFRLRAAVRMQARPGDADLPWPAQLLCAFGVAPPRDGAQRFDADGMQALASAHALIAKATRTIDVATFILGGRHDAIAQGFIDALAAAVARGVKVRLLLDGLASRATDLAAIRARGIEVKWFRPLLGRSDGVPRNLRNHRKLMVADGVRLWSGGRNLAREYFVDADGSPAWVDLSFTVEGKVAADAASLFERDWRDHVGEPLEAGAMDAPVTAADSGSTQLLPSGPDMPEDCAHAVLMEACYRARSSIVAVTPYFVPDDALAQALRIAVVRGVRVEILVPAASNHRMADIARARAMRDLADAGVRFHLFPRMVHAKAFLVDDRFAACGSLNLDPRSLFLNHELSLLFYGQQDIAWLRKWLRQHIDEAQPYKPVEPGLGRDLFEGMVRSVAFQL